MATLDYRTTCELNRPVTIKHLDGMFFSQDVQANRIVVSVVRGGVNENLSGTVSANIIRADGSTVVQTGSISGNVASVTMPAAAYAVPGAIAVFVKHTQSGVTSTIAAVTGYVYKSTTDTIVDPGTIIPSIQDLLESIDDAIEDLEEAIAAIPQDYQDLEDDVSDLKRAVDYKLYSEVEDHGGYLTGSLKWLYVTSTKYRHIVIEITPGDKIDVTAGTNSAQIGFMRSYSAPVENAYADFSEQTGFTSLIDISASANAHYTVPSDAYYLYILKLNNNNDRNISKIVINGIDLTKAISENLSHISSMVSELQEDVEDTESAIGLLEKHIPYTMLDEYAMTSGYINGTKWLYVTSTKYKHILVPVNANDVVEIKSSSNGAQVACLKTNTAPVENASVDFSEAENFDALFSLNASKTVKFSIPSDTNYLYVLILNNNTDMTPVSVAINGIDISKTLRGNIDDIFASSLSENTAEKNHDTIGYTKLSDFEVKNGGINVNVNTWVDYGWNANERKHIAIPVNPGDSVQFIGHATNTGWFGFLKTYTVPIFGGTADMSEAEGFTTVKNINSNSETDVYTVPDDSHYMYLLIKGSGGSDVTPASVSINRVVISKSVKENIQIIRQMMIPTSDVNVCVMGDSIPQGFFSRYDSPGVPGTYTDVTGKAWPYVVSKMNAWNLTNKAWGGTGYLKISNNVVEESRGYKMARTTDFTPYNLVLLAYGINDWTSNCQMGDISVDASLTEHTTFYGAMKATIEAIIASNPMAKIFVITPMNERNRGTWETNWSLGYAWGNTGTLESFVQAMIEVCNFYGIQYIDMTHYACVNRNNMETILPDGIHPTLDGHALIAHELYKKITF